MSTLFYIQDSRSYVGNDVLWWCKDGRGYTTDLRKAGVYSLEEAQSVHNNRSSDIPWPKEYIDNHTRPAVDMQYINHAVAIKDSDITIIEHKPKNKSKEKYRCEGCGRIMSEIQFWSSKCKNCDTDNRP